MDEELVEVARVQGPIESEVVRGVLESNDIPVTLRTRVPHSVFPLSVDGLGEVRVYVPSEHAEPARELLAGHRQAGLTVVRSDENG